MPTTPMGKVDREPLQARALSTSVRPAVTETHSIPASIDDAVADILKRVLGLRVIEADDNLFDLGANSITIIQVAARIEWRFAIDVPVSAVFDRPTQAQLVTYLRERLGDDVAQPRPVDPVNR
ncbi:MAG TPA: phosphopantetheine-binding protein [Casimicrobiaceae bacterium]|nr:phosphopantetheine-binding protein [Casimicrobiaceae bacterium]